MAGKYRAYPEYKDSGVEWLGEIPNYWDAWKFKHCLLEPMIYGANEAALDDSRENPRYIRITDMNADGTLRDETFKSLPEEVAKDYLLDDGDILLARTGATVGKSFKYKSEFGACCFAGYLVRARVNPEVVEPDFIYWYLQSDSYWKHISGSQIQATIQNVSAEKYGDLVIPLPRVRDDRVSIVNFLSVETAKIETLIEKQQQLIRLLKEKRQAVISHAVTKGLNPNVPMKDSGVEWLGEVPAHWNVCKLKHIKAKTENAFVDGPFGSNLKSEHFVENGDVYVIESNFATTGVLDASILKTISKGHFETIKRSATQGGDIIIAKIGARYGSSSILPSLDKEAVVSGNSLKLTVDDDHVHVEYANELLKHLKQAGGMDDGVNITAQPALSLGTLNNLPFIVPPMYEQLQIVEFLLQTNSRYMSLISNADAFIKLAQERRTALISAAVTGKIDVRDWQPPRG